MGSGRAARRRCLLHPQRLPDHRPAPRAVGPRRHPAGPLLAGPRPAAAARPLPDARGGDGLGHRHRPPPAAELQGSRGRRSFVREQLVADLPARLLLRALWITLAPQPPLVPGGRGAVLHHLAIPLTARHPLHPRGPPPLRFAPQAGRRDSAPRRRLGYRDGAALSPEPRPLAGLLRDRHPGQRAPGRSRPGDGLAQPAADEASRGRRSAPPRQPWRSGPDRHRPDDLAHQRVLPFPLPGRLHAAGAGDGARHRRARPARLQAGLRPRLAPPALDRGALIWDLPLALPDHRPDDARRRPRHQPAPRRPPGRGDHRCCGALVAIRRGADSPRRPRAPLEAAQVGRMAPGVGPAKGLGGPDGTVSASSSSPAPGWPGWARAPPSARLPPRVATSRKPFERRWEGRAPQPRPRPRTARPVAR